MKKFLINICLLAGSVTFGISVMEWSVRAFFPQPLVRAYNTPDIELGTYLTSNAVYVDQYTKEHPYEVRTNSMSFRMDEEVDMSPDRDRILVYGDSFTFGWGLEIEDTYFRLLKRAVEAGMPRLQLINAGVGGYSTGHIKKLMERHLPVLRPSAIVYFFNNNDLVDNAIRDNDYQVTQYRFGEDGEVELTDVQPFSPWKRYLLNYTPYAWLNKHSHLFVLGKDILKRLLNWKMQLQIPDVSSPVAINTQPSFTTKVPETLGSDSRLRSLVKISEAHVRRISQIARKHDVPVFLIWLPAPEEMFPPEKMTAQQKLLVLGRGMLAEQGRKNPGMDFADITDSIKMTPEWLAQSGSLRLSDGHFNAAGSRWYADLVRPALMEYLRNHMKISTTD